MCGLNGSLLWISKTQLHLPYSIAVSPAGKIYVADLLTDCFYEYTSHGVLANIIALYNRDNIGPYGFSIDSTGTWLVYNEVRHFKKNSVTNVEFSRSQKIFKLNIKSGVRHLIIEGPPTVFSIDIYQNKYLVLGTWHGLSLYDVSNIF